MKQAPDAEGAAAIARGAQALAQGQPVPNQHLCALMDGAPRERATSKRL